MTSINQLFRKYLYLKRCRDEIWVHVYLIEFNRDTIKNNTLTHTHTFIYLFGTIFIY
jgi:hypothetical protein